MRKKTVLNVGCGSSPVKPDVFPPKLWREIRVDVDPEVKPDIVAWAHSMPMIESGSHDGVYSSHAIEHVYAHEVMAVLLEFNRVLKVGGRIVITCPDIQTVAAHVAVGHLESALYESPAGPICAIDIMYGHRGYVAGGNLFYAHKTAFTAQTLGARLKDAGFAQIKVQRVVPELALWAFAEKA